jgi:hypothetical protein
MLAEGRSKMLGVPQFFFRKANHGFALLEKKDLA